MAKKPKSSDGLTKLGPGKWLARITARDPHTGEKTIDTDRVIKKESKLEALKERERIRAELLGGGEEWFVREACAEFLKTQRPGSLSVRKAHLRRFEERFGDRRLSLVTTPEMQQWLFKLGVGDDTANYHRATVRAMYSFAREKGRLCGENPAADSVKRHTRKSNDDYLEEIDRDETPAALYGNDIGLFFSTLEAQEPDLYPILKCQLLLGCRISEALALRWHDIDFDTGAVTIRLNVQKDGSIGPTKAKKKRVCALGPEGLAFMRGHKAAMERLARPGHEVWCFPRPVFGRRRTRDTWVYETVRLGIRAVIQATGLKLARVTHTMRHTHVSLARALQMDAMLMAAVGHADRRQTEDYTDQRARKAAAVGYASDFESRLAGGVSGGGTVTDITKSLKNTR